ncbi:MAG: chorismate synthase [Gemmatimonadales bacterium]
MMRFTTAGESHGRGLVVVVEGVPSGLTLLAQDIDRDLRRRMMGYGRGARMKIESDRVEFLSGVRAGETIGSPVAMLIWNRDWENWSDVMAPEPDVEGPSERRRRVVRPRPGHADLVGTLKYARSDARDILERASARETAARVAAGAVCRRLLEEFGVEIGSHVVELGSVAAASPDPLPAPLNRAADESPVRCLDPRASQAMVAAIDAAIEARDTLGGVVEVVIRGVVLGLGSHVSWDTRLDGRLAQAIMSIPAIKGVEIGIGFEAARKPGSEVHDEIVRGGPAFRGGIARRTNRAGGLEGGMTTGEPIVIRAAMKPISTLRRPLGTVNLETGGEARAQSERADVTAVPAAGVVAEAMAAVTLAAAMAEKFGGDSLAEMRANYEAFVGGLDERWDEVSAPPASEE